MTCRFLFSLALLSTLLLILPSALFAQISLSGTVNDPSGAALVHCDIVLYARDGSFRRTTSTDNQGRYRIEALAPGDYFLEATAPDFAPTAALPVRIEAGEDRTVDIDLALGEIRTEVIVTSSTTPLTAEQVAKALDSVHRRQIEMQAEFSIPEALRSVPGLRVRQQRGPGGNTSIQVRGLRSEDTAVLVDGYRLRDAASTDGSASGLLPDLMAVSTDRVEVLRGSGSSIYGTGATGGAINIVTDQGGGRNHGKVQVEGGGLGLLRGLARLGGGALRDRFTYSAGSSHLNVLNGIDGSDAYRNSTAHGAVQYAFTPRASLSGRIWASDSFVQLNDSPFVPDEAAPNLPLAGVIESVPLPLDQQRLVEAGRPFEIGRATFIADPNDPDKRRSSSFFSGLANFTQRISPSTSFRVGYHWLDTDKNFRDGPAGVRFEPGFNNSSSFDSRIDTLQARSDWKLGTSQLITVGYDFEREEYDSPSNDENPDPSLRVNVRQKIDQRSHSVFAQDQFRWLDSRLQLSLSARAQAFRLSQPEFIGGNSPYARFALESPSTAYTGDGAISYHFAVSGTKLRAHVGNAYKAPSLFQRFGSSFFFGSFTPFGDPRLRPERTIAFDAGIDQWMADNRVRFSATYFYTRLQEVIFFDFTRGIDPSTDPFGRFGGYRNTGGGLARGIELSVSASPSRRTDLTASYTYTNSDERTSQVAAGDFFKAFGISDHTFTLTLMQRIGRRFDLAADFFVTSDFRFPLFTRAGARAFNFDGPVKADVVVNYTVPVSDLRSFRIYGKVQNVFDHEYFEGSFRSPGIWSTVGLAFAF